MFRERPLKIERPLAVDVNDELRAVADELERTKAAMKTFHAALLVPMCSFLDVPIESPDLINQVRRGLSEKQLVLTIASMESERLKLRLKHADRLRGVFPAQLQQQKGNDAADANVINHPRLIPPSIPSSPSALGARRQSPRTLGAKRRRLLRGGGTGLSVSQSSLSIRRDRPGSG